MKKLAGALTPRSWRMPRQILDLSNTDDAKDADEHQIPLQLPSKVRKFGYIPDCSKWQAGDLLLVSAVTKSFRQRSIVRVQEGLGFDESHAKWHHAAVYIGKRRLLEARATGVRNGLVDEIASDYRIVVRRAPEISRDQGYELAIQALLRLRSSYNTWSALKSFWHSIRGAAQSVHRHRNVPPPRAVTCSQLFHSAYTEATSGVLVDRVDTPIVPAELSACPGLQDVPGSALWLKLRPEVGGVT